MLTFSLKFCTAIEWPGRHEHVAAVLQQGVHRHDEESRDGADQDQHHVDRGHPFQRHHADHDDAHDDSRREHVHGALERDEARGERGADGDADRRDSREHRALLERKLQVRLGPLDHDELQAGARAPEERGHGERDLSQLVLPQHHEAAREIEQEPDGIALLVRVARAGVGYREVEERGDHVDQRDHDDRGLRAACPRWCR